MGRQPAATPRRAEHVEQEQDDERGHHGHDD
jgi:hypothetical protein